MTKIKTFAVAFGTGISGRGINTLMSLAKAGGTKMQLLQHTTASLKVQLKAAISQIIASNFLLLLHLLLQLLKRWIDVPSAI